MPRVKQDSITVILHEVKNGLRRYVCSYTIYNKTEDQVRKSIEKTFQVDVKNAH